MKGYSPDPDNVPEKPGAPPGEWATESAQPKRDIAIIRKRDGSRHDRIKGRLNVIYSQTARLNFMLSDGELRDVKDRIRGALRDIEDLLNEEKEHEQE